VATLTVQTTLVVERTSPHAPHNVTVTRKARPIFSRFSL
jgi:hypothetical protein